MAAQARLAGLEVGTSSVICSLGLSPVAQLAPLTSTIDSVVRTMKTDKTTTRNAKLRTVRSRRMHVKDSIQAYIAYAASNTGRCDFLFYTISQLRYS